MKIISAKNIARLFVTWMVGTCSLLSVVAQDYEPAITAEWDGGKVYGEMFPIDSEPSTLLEALENPVDGERVISGTINQVCQKKGCWIILTQGLEHVRVRTKDHAFFLPKDSAGKAAKVVGVLTEVTLSKAQAKHFAEDAEKASVAGESMKNDGELERKEFQLSARSIWIAD